MKLLDLSKFEKIAEDKNTTRMRHKDGHEMVILHAKLPKIHREQLKRLKMAKGGMAHYADGSDDQPVSQDDQANDQDNPDHSTNLTINMPAAAPSVPGPVSNQTPASPMANQLAAQPQANAPAINQNLASPAGAAQSQAQAAQYAEQAGNLQQKIDAASAQGKMAIAQQQQQNAVDIQNRQNQTMADMQQHTKDFADYMAQHPIDPKAYLENMGAAKKTATGLGLLLGGFAGGLNGSGNNPAMNFLMAQQDKDIASQKARMDQAHTIYGAYHQLYNDENVATALTKVSMNDKLAADSSLLAAKLQTPQAQAANLNLRAQLLQKNYENLQKAAFLANQPGGNVAAPGVAPTAPPQNPPGGASASWGPAAEKTASILAPDAQQKLNQLAQRANSGDAAAAAQLPEARQQFENAVQVDKALAQIDNLYPELQNKATWGGYAANKINPHAIAALAAAGAEYAGAAAAPATGGASLLAALPGAAVAGGLGEVAGSGLKQTARMIGGQQETQYETARDALTSIIGGAIGPSAHLTPSEVGDIADQFIPTKVDSAATAKDKLEKLKEKIKALTKTSALKGAGMLN
jgi:hypothetical protein